MKHIRCPSCNNKAHNFVVEEALDCVPPPNVLQFGQYQLSAAYRAALYDAFPFYTAEEVIGSYLGYNPNWPSQDDWAKTPRAEQ